MKTFVASGASYALTMPYDRVSGQGVLVGSIFGVVAETALSGAVAEVWTTGIFDVTKQGSLAISAGARLFWDNTNRYLTTVQNGNVPVGVAVVAAGSSDTTVRALITQAAADTPGAVSSRVLSLPVTAVANTDLTIPVPAGHILRISQRTTTAYTGATVTVQVGTTVGGAEIVAAVDIKGKAVRQLTLVDANNDTFTPFAGGTVYVRIVQTTPTAVGAGQLIIEFVPTT